MRPVRAEEQQLPILLFLLENGKHRQVIKTMLNAKLSRKLLAEYGHQFEDFSKLEEFKINEQIQHFSVDELIEIKGASESKVKRYENAMLQQLLLRKIKLSHEALKPETRRALWLQFTEIFAQQHLYDGLSELQLPPDTEALLEKDIKRTYAEHREGSGSEQQNQKTEVLRSSAREVLSRFALYNPYILYCQGMNEIVAFFHQEGFSAKEIFFLLKRLTEEILPSDYYSSLQGITANLKVLWEIMTVLFPKIHSKLSFLIRELDINGSYLCVFSNFVQWFVCLFANSSINREIRRVFFDYFLLEGITVMFKTSIAFLGFLEPHILETQSFDQYVTCIQKTIAQYDDVEHFTNVLDSQFISKEILELYAHYSMPPDLPKNLGRKIIGFEKKCSRKWNYCQQQLEDNIQTQRKYEFFVFKPRQNVKIVPDYLEKLNNFYFSRKKSARPTDLLKIGRISHICNSTSETCTEDSLSETNTKKNQSPKSIRHSPTPRKFSEYSINIKQPLQSADKVSVRGDSREITEFGYSSEEKKSSDHLQVQYHRKETLEYREQIKRRIEQETGRGGLQKSESMMFMRMMVENESYSNLFNLLESEEMDRMFDLGEESSGESDS